MHRHTQVLAQQVEPRHFVRFINNVRLVFRTVRQRPIANQGTLYGKPNRKLFRTTYITGIGLDRPDNPHIFNHE